MIFDVATAQHTGGLNRWQWILAAIRPDGEQRANAINDASRAFEAFFWRFERKIFGYLWRMTGDEQSASDLTQETFLRAWQHFGELTGPRDAGAWLFRVAANLALSHLRRRGAIRMLPLDEESPGASDPGRGVAERDAVRQTLLRLTPHQRSALVLHEVYDLTCDEIAPIMGISRDAVKMALWRGREAFREQYLREEGAS